MWARYDEIADWYELEFLAGQGEDDPLEVGLALTTLLGPGSGPCLEIGCGTGVHAETVRALGRTPVGVDLSGEMLRYAKPRLPVVRANAERLPLRDASVPAAVAVLVHTDMPGYPDVVREAARVLEPGGVFVHIGVHPCFCGGFADRSDPAALVVRRGYRESGWTTDSWTDQGLRDKVGAAHWPLPDLLSMFLDAGLVLDGFTEGGGDSPLQLSIRARKSS
ncbi:MAG TPA: class I SAM-dependent methyltransferase [Amycolatopsis sp.]